MSRYDKVYERLASRAVRQGVVDLETFVEMARDAGMSEKAIEAALLEDLETGGPIFGKFMRSLTGASASTAVTASRQGEALAAIEADETLKEVARLSSGRGSALRADPGEIAEYEEAVADRMGLTWVATLVNTCHLCLPLHGKTLTKREWEELGLHPDTIHANAGWSPASKCKCSLVPAKFGKASSFTAPLIRKKIETPTGLKPNKRTARSVLQADVDKAMKAVEEASNSLAGRRTLRLLGTAKGQGK